MEMEIETYELPVYWACYLINDDPSNLSEIEVAEVDRFVEELGEDFRVFSCMSVDMETCHMTNYHDASHITGRVLMEVAEYKFATYA